MVGGSFRIETHPQPDHLQYDELKGTLIDLYTARCALCPRVEVVPFADTAFDAIRGFTGPQGGWQIEDNLIKCPDHAD